MREVGGELFHLADRVRLAALQQHGVIGPHHLVAVALGRLVVACRSPGTAAIWRKIHGFDEAARPIITASQPVSRTMRTASSGVRMSPLPITGILHRGLHFGDAGPVGLAAVALLAGARMQRHGLQAAILGQSAPSGPSPVPGRSSRREISW